MIEVGSLLLTTEDYRRVLFEGEKIGLDKDGLEKVRESYAYLESCFRNKIIYGINTGLGPMAQYRIDEANRLKLQYNAIRSHASGTGDPVKPLYVRAALLTLLNQLMKGFSGLHPCTVTLITDLLNAGITPLVPGHGGVGASGDLVQLAHIALVLIGEGEVFVDGNRMPTREAFAARGLEPAGIYIREGLGLINGTSFMTGTGMVNLIHATNLIRWSILVSSMMNEIVCSFDDYFSKALNAVKLHPGQQKVAEAIRNLLHDSRLIRKREDHFFNHNNHYEKYIAEDKVQEYYSLRCTPQIIGPILDTAEQAGKVLLEEVNSSSDNPVVSREHDNIFHGGNFHGDYVSFEMDKLKIAMTKLSMLFERQINYLMNNRLNEKLPPFVNLGVPGVNFGMQGAQFTATSTTAENQTLSYPSYLHSIPNNNDNQDIVSMGTNAAQLTAQVIDNTYQVLAIELLSIVQAIDCLKIEPRMSSATREAYTGIRQLVPAFVEDTVKYVEINRIKDYLCSQFLKP